MLNLSRLSDRFRGVDNMGEHPMKVFEAIRTIGGIRRLASWMQQTFAGKRDIYSIYGYTLNPSYEQKLIKYLRQDVAGRVVDAPAAALWTNPPQVTSSNEAFNSAWQDLVAKYKLWAHMEKADKLAGIGHYSIILIGFNDGSSLDKPVNTRSITQKQKGKINYLQVYSQYAVQIKEIDSDERSENFGKPKIYTIQPGRDLILGFDANRARNKNSYDMNKTMDVHYSRVIHIAENTMESDIVGSPRIERVYNLLDDILKVAGGSAETFWLTANRGLHIDIDKEMELDPTDAANLSAELDEYQHQLRRVIRTRGADIKSLGSDTPDPRGTFSVLIALLSGATGIPQRVLLGSEAGQLASQQDRANWAERIDERRIGWANPYVIYQIFQKFTAAGYLPEADTNQITVAWPSAFKMSPFEEAQTSAQHARSATNFAKAIETMENMKKGVPGTPDTTDPITGKTIPGTPEEPGLDLEDLITVPEARKLLGLDKPEVTYDSGSDIT